MKMIRRSAWRNSGFKYKTISRSWSIGCEASDSWAGPFAFFRYLSRSWSRGLVKTQREMIRMDA